VSGFPDFSARTIRHPDFIKGLIFNMANDVQAFSVK
jgi:hypothetical protein